VADPTPAPEKAAPAESGRDAQGHWLPGTMPPGQQFPPGVSGCPGGLPKWVKKIREAAAGHGTEAVDVLVSIMLDREAPHAARISAADSLLDRAGARPIAVEGDKLELTAPVDVEALRAQLVIRVLRLIGAPEQPASVEPPASAPAQLAPAVGPASKPPGSAP
jgi:hypothetical protein